MKIRFRAILVLLAVVCLLIAGLPSAQAQDKSSEVTQLKERIRALESQVSSLTGNAERAVKLVPAVLNREAPAPPTEERAPAPPPAQIRSLYVRELLPEIGKIGAEIGLLAGGSLNPFKLNSGIFAGGYIDLPLRRVPGGKLSYEILAGMSESYSKFETSSQVAVVANLAAGASLANSLQERR